MPTSLSIQQRTPTAYSRAHNREMTTGGRAMKISTNFESVNRKHRIVELQSDKTAKNQPACVPSRARSNLYENTGNTTP